MAKAKIMVVEDEGLVVLAIRQCLENLGYEVPGTFATGEEAVERAGDLCPDLVLMDIRLKGEMDGITAAEQIREALGIPVIYLTAYSDESTLERAKITEPFGYVLKPFEEKSLQTAIEMGLYKSRMQRKLQQTTDRLSTILRCIGDGVIVADTKGEVSFLNPAAEDITAFTQEEAIGKNLSEIIRVLNSKTRQRTDLPLTKTIIDGQKIMQEDYLLVAKDGKELPVDFSVAPIRNENDNTTGIVLAIRDATERTRVREMIHRELEATQEMQRNLLPANDVTVSGIQFNWLFHPSSFGAGDLINFFRLGDRYIVFYLLDVIGHGLPAAVMSMVLHRILSPDLSKGGILKSTDSGFISPREVVTELNRQFYDRDGSQFFTIVYGMVNTITGKATIARAGHHYPILQKHGAPTELIEPDGLAVGVFPDNHPQEYEGYFQAGDRLFIYSDGLVECLDTEQKQFSMERLTGFLDDKRQTDLHVLAADLEREILEWRGKNQFDDDISFLALERT